MFFVFSTLGILLTAFLFLPPPIFLLPWKSELDAMRGKILTLGIQTFFSHHLLVSWRTESWNGWSSWWCWKEDVLWKGTKSWSNYAFGSGHFVQGSLARKIQWSSFTEVTSFSKVCIVSARIFTFSKKMHIGRRNLRRRRKEMYQIWIGIEIEHLEKIKRRMLIYLQGMYCLTKSWRNPELI